MKPGGYACWTDAEGKVFERDTVGCGHCGMVAFVKPGTASAAQAAIPLVGVSGHVGDAKLLPPEHDADMGGFCTTGMHFICGPCADEGGPCVPFIKKVDALDAQQARLDAWQVANR